MWIMLTRKPPTTISPPKLSFHWAAPWRDDRRSVNDKVEKATQKRAEKLYGIDELDRTVRQQRIVQDAERCRTYLENERCFYDEYRQGKEPDWDGAMCIFFEDEKIRIFPHEYTTDHSMKLFLEEEGALIKHPLSASAHEAKNFTGAKKILVEHAMVDGCTALQAELLAMGLDPFEAEVPPTAWYEMRREYAETYCTEAEMRIDYRNPPAEPVFSDELTYICPECEEPTLVILSSLEARSGAHSNLWVQCQHAECAYDHTEWDGAAEHMFNELVKADQV